jgi:radical SAM superfamily enzyme YgiQ (UPF0313 family)
MAMVAAYAKKTLGENIDMELFKYPEDFSNYLDKNTPQIACFSIFAWNNHLSHEYAKRLKEANPKTITLFGGPNWPNHSDEKKEFLKKWSSVDFAVEGEGEIAFVEFFKVLKEYNFDFQKIKRKGIKIPNTSYLRDGKIITGEILPRLENLDQVPSVYENGLSDKFFDKHLIPMIQTARGCPYACTFCHEGSLYFNKTRRFSQERTKYEIDYIAKRVKVPDFIIVDLNYGMFEEDITTSKYMARMQDTLDWPKFVTIATAKNHKQRVLEISKILHGSLPPGAAVQSTDPGVLKIIKRTNLPMEAVVEVAKTAETDGAASFSEVILCLPGDSKRAHFQSIKDVIDAGFTLIRTYQFMLLAGTEAGGNDARKQYNYDTRFRIKPMNFGKYKFRGKEFVSAEIEEICVSNNTMNYQDYRECRELSLTVEIFNNNGIFYDFLQFLDLQGVTRAEFLFKIHELVKKNDLVSSFYRDFAKDEEENLWKDERELRDFMSQPKKIDEYLRGDYGTNEIYKYRAIAVFNNIEEIHKIVYQASCELLDAKGLLNKDCSSYLNELKRFSLMRKAKIFAVDKKSEDTFHYDFVQLLDSNFAKDPFKLKRPEGMSIETYHTKRQQSVIEGYIDQFGTTLVGLGRILNRAHIAAMHRDAKYSGSNEDKNALRKKNQTSEERATAGPTGGDMIEQY